MDTFFFSGAGAGAASALAELGADSALAELSAAGAGWSLLDLHPVAPATTTAQMSKRALVVNMGLDRAAPIAMQADDHVSGASANASECNIGSVGTLPTLVLATN
ncbi:hypothetical protein [Enhygromyxa salina]|uniref:hypothetical protein n=1 Tax=Enhygromyxa salina TaxID=215803 RepID=UPI001969C09F|nr:hypothetical protein [Enhygromyxa salina]